MPAGPRSYRPRTTTKGTTIADDVRRDGDDPPPGRLDVDGRDVARMVEAMVLASEAAALGEVPVGAILVVPGEPGERVFAARNEKESRPDPTAHAEILALRAGAATLGRWRVGGTLYVTKEPCAMCAGALVAARVARLVYGCDDLKAGAAGSVIDVFASQAANHRVVVVRGVQADETAAQLRAFFAARRGRAAAARGNGRT